MRYIKCFVLNCTSSTKKLYEWDEANGPPPFQMKKFPTNRTERKTWIAIVNRSDTDCPTKKLLQPGKYNGICSLHFETNSSVPTKDLGYPTDDPLTRLLLFNPDQVVGVSPVDKVGDVRTEENVGTSQSIRIREEKESSSSAGCTMTVKVSESLLSSQKKGVREESGGSTGSVRVRISESLLSSQRKRLREEADVISSVSLTVGTPESLLPAQEKRRRVEAESASSTPSMPDNPGMSASTSGLIPLRVKRLRKESDSHSSGGSSPVAVSPSTSFPIPAPLKRIREQTDSPSSGGSSPVLLPAAPFLDSPLHASPEKTSSSSECRSQRPSQSDCELTTPVPLRIQMTPLSRLQSNERTVGDLTLENRRLRERGGKLIELYQNLARKVQKHRNAKKKRKSDETEKLVNSDAKASFYTGFQTVATYNGMFKVFESRAQKMRYWKPGNYTPKKTNSKKKTLKKPGPQRKLTLKQEYLMTLMRIRLGLLEEDLADRFGVSVTHVSKLLITWTKFLAEEFSTLIERPPKSACRLSLPQSFQCRALRNVNHIIDCFEVFGESTGDLNLQSVLWSQYKHHRTVKFLIDIQPNGYITFVSRGFPGRISDKKICAKSGFYDTLQPKDVLLADKGFPIEPELRRRDCTLLIPKGRRGITQFSKEDLIQISNVAVSRIHVERAIRRVKCFRILKSELVLATVAQISDIVKIICGIVNTLPPVIDDKKNSV